VAGVLDHETNAVVPCEVNRKLDLRYVGGVYSVGWVATLGATFRVEQRRWLAGQADFVWTHHFDWIIASVRMLASD
jgi:hypothetical protein